jgi:methionine-rich copper-binding protein CopC
MHVLTPPYATRFPHAHWALRWRGRFLFALLLGVSVVLISPFTAFAQAAHAEYVRSTPEQNAILHQEPATISILFSEAVNPAGSTIQVYDVNGKQVNTAAAQVDRSNLETMTVPMQGDGSELYVVLWRTVSAVEGHHDSGSFRFFVNPSPMLSSMLKGGSMASMPAATSSPSSSTGLPLWSVILVGILGLVIGGGGSFFFTRRTAKAQ